MLRGESAQVTGGVAEKQEQRARQVQVHLPGQRQLELVERARAGASNRELAEAYGVHRATVAAVLKRHGVERRRGLDEAGIQEAVRRYEAGESLATVGRALGVDPGTVKARLVERGVRMRDTSGRPIVD
jgi:hypothetical protein